MKVRKAIIPAAGLGTRFLPVTKSIPKEMLPIIDKPILQYIFEEIVDSGIEEILVVTTRNKESIQNHFDRNLEYEYLLDHAGKSQEKEMIVEISKIAQIYYVRQGVPEGLGHAVHICKKFIDDEPFALLLGDEVYFGENPALKQMTDLYDQTQASILCVGEVADDEVSSYGIVELKDESKYGYKEVKSLVEKPPVGQAPSNLAIYGRYILNPTIFTYLDQIERGVGGEYQLTDALNLMLKEESILPVQVDSSRFDVGSKIGYIKANLYKALESEEYKDQVVEFFQDQIKKI